MVGITVDCPPLLDLQVEGADQIIGDRSFSDNPEFAGTLGLEVMRAFQDHGLTSIIKHIPTHGPADCHSHLMLPRVTLSHEELKPHFQPFKACKEAPWAMTAHIIYEAFDPENPATQSPKVIQDIIRGEIDFQGILVSDDIGMKALSGPFTNRAQKALHAGCDIVLHCSGDMNEMKDTIEGVSPLTSEQAVSLVNFRSETWQELRDIALFTLLYGPGLPISEALSLNVEDLPTLDDDRLHSGSRKMGKSSN